MNLNLELRFQPFKISEGARVCYPTIGTGHNSLLLKRVQTPPRDSRLPAACPYLPLSAAVRRLLRLGGPWLLSQPREHRSLFPARSALPAPLLSAAAHGAPGDAPLPLRLCQSIPGTANRDLEGPLHPLPEREASQQDAAETTSENPAGKRL